MISILGGLGGATWCERLIEREKFKKCKREKSRFGFENHNSEIFEHHDSESRATMAEVTYCRSTLRVEMSGSSGETSLSRCPPIT